MHIAYFGCDLMEKKFKKLIFLLFSTIFIFLFIANVSANNNLSESSVLEEFDSSLRDNDVNFNNCGDDSSNINLDENSLNCNSSNLSGDSINYKNFSRKNLSVSSYEFGGDIDVSRYGLIGDDDVSLSNYASGKMGTHIVSNDFVQTWDDSKFFKACLSDDYNNSLVNKLVFMTISISNNSKTYNSTTDNEGYVCLQINLCTGEYSIDSSFEGDNQYSSSFKSNKIIVNKADTSLTSQDFTFNQEGNYFTAKLLDNYGNPIVNSTVNVGLRNAWGSKVYYKNTDENGIVKLQMNLNTGIYYIDYSFGGSTNYKSSFGTNTFNMVNNKLTSSVIIVNNTIKKGGYFSAILQDNNRLAMSNQSIDFVLSIGSYSKTYYLITNSNGESSLQINLAPNNWRMDVVYGGSNYFSSSSSNCNLNINLTPDFSYAISISADSKRFIQVDNLNKVYSFNKWVSGSSSINIVTGQYYFMSLDSCDSSPEIFSSISSINKSGVLLYGSGNSFNLVYYDIAPLSVNQFSAVYDRGGELGFERVIFVLNGVKKVSLSFSVNLWSKILGPEEITTKFSENGVEVLNKKEIITYGYSTYSKSNGFDMVQSFAIVKSEVNDAVIRAWLNCEGLYPEGGMKAAYGTFMTSLTTMWLNDMLANQESKYLGVKWVRNDYLTVFTGYYA